VARKQLVFSPVLHNSLSLLSVNKWVFSLFPPTALVTIWQCKNGIYCVLVRVNVAHGVAENGWRATWSVFNQEPCENCHVETGTKETCGRTSPFSVLLPIRITTKPEDGEVTSTGPVCFHVQSNHALWKQQMVISFSRFTLYQQWPACLPWPSKRSLYFLIREEKTSPYMEHDCMLRTITATPYPKRTACTWLVTF